MSVRSDLASASASGVTDPAARTSSAPAPPASTPRPEDATADRAAYPPLGPDSLTWELFGDLRGLLLTARAGILQNMHPALAAGVVEHSDVFENLWNRLLRSAPPILGVVYDGADAPATGATVRDYHRHVKGRDEHGRRYHALDPEVYFWAHATFFESQIAGAAWFGTPLTPAEQERLYEESVRWYAQYGVSMRPVPPDYAAFRRYWDHMVEHVLEPTTPVRWAIDPARRRDVPPPYPWIPRPLWWALRPLVMGGSIWIATGTMPPVLRERLGLSWSARDERRLRAFGRLVAAAMRLVPHDLRYMPRARAAWRRERRRARRAGAPRWRPWRTARRASAAGA